MACQKGFVKVVTLLLGDLRVDVNRANKEGATALYVSCSFDQREVLRLLLLLDSSRLDVNQCDALGILPLHVAGDYGLLEIAVLLMKDERVQVNLPTKDGRTALFMAAERGHLSVVQHLLVSDKEIDLWAKSVKGVGAWCDKRPVEIAEWASGQRKWSDESEEEFDRRRQGCPSIALLLHYFEADPETARRGLRTLPGIREPFVAETFALVVFLSDHYLALKSHDSGSDSSSNGNGGNGSNGCNTRRFFRITNLLPLELQMVLCNVVFDSPKELVLSKHSEPVFRKLARVVWTR